MYQDPINQGRSQKPQQHNPDQQESLAGFWQKITESAQHFWNRLTHEDIQHARQAGRPGLIRVLQQRYGFSAEEADRHVENFLEQMPKKGVFERMTEVNGNLKLNQYVSNPAPGPSARDDQPPGILAPDTELSRSGPPHRDDA